jgi:hypothetical protein
MQPLGLNDGLQPPMSDVFTLDYLSWSYSPIVPPVLRTTTLPLPRPSEDNQLPVGLLQNARPAHDAAYWAAKMSSFDFKHSDHLNSAVFNRALWQGLRGNAVPYPTIRTGRNLRKNRKALLARAEKRPPSQQGTK